MLRTHVHLELLSLIKELTLTMKVQTKIAIWIYLLNCGLKPLLNQW